MRQERINNVLKDLYQSCIDNGKGFELTREMVYQYLIYLGLPIGERKKSIKPFFDKWIRHFKNNPDIRVFNSPDWKYFCQFISKETISPYCIKMYISLDSLHIEKGAKMIFEFLTSNNIVHMSKIGSHIRTDDIVIRLSNKEDALKLQRFIEGNEYIREGMNKLNPFCFQSNGVGYAYDGYLSYNECISELITRYINERIKNNVSIDNININDFYSYVNNISDYSMFPRVYDEDERIKDANQVVNLLKLSLKSNSINDFFMFYDSISTEKEMVSKEDLLKELILTTMKKYPKGYDKDNPFYSGFDFLSNVFKGNISGVTRTNNLRERVLKNLSLNDIVDIANSHFIDGKNNFEVCMNYAKMIILNEMIRCSEERFPGYGTEQVKNYIDSGRLSYITEKVGSARSLAKSLNPEMIQKLFYDFGVCDVDEYASNYYDYSLNDRVRR